MLRRYALQLDRCGFPVKPGRADFPRDPADAKFLACAHAAEADYFITGDRDFIEARKSATTTILSAGLFKKLIIDTAA